MKKYLTLVSVASAALLLSSCSTVKQTATALPIETTLFSNSTADLQVSQKKITYKYFPTRSVKRGGDDNVLRTAIYDALKANGDADVLVAMQYEVKRTTNVFGHTSIKYVVVTGYPARYINVQPLKNW